MGIKCLILAAGRGSRIADKCDCKPLLPLLELPLIERAIVTAHGAGITDFLVVTGYNGSLVEAFLADLCRRRNLAIETLRNDQWQKGNGTSVLCAQPRLEDDFVILMADHVFDGAILERLLRARPQTGEILLAADYNIEGNPYVDVNDVTKVLTESHRVIDIGKKIDNFNAFDTGVFRCSPAIFPALAAASREDDNSLSGGVRRLAALGKANTLDIQGHYWIDIDIPADLKNAKSLLYSSLRKPHDGFVSRTINRKLSLGVFTPLLLKISPRLTANQVSVLAFFVGLLASLCFFFGYPVMGGIAMQLSSILDGCDGEIARLKKSESSFGNFFDSILDRYADSFILFAMFLYSWEANDNLAIFGPNWRLPVLVVAMAAIVGNLMVSYTSAKSIADFGYRYRGPWVGAGRGRDLRLFILSIGAVLAVVHPITVLLALATVGILTNAVVVRRIWLSRTYAISRNPLVGVELKAVAFDFDGTIADTMPLLTKLAVDLITRNYDISEEEAERRYRETTGMNFASQMELIFPGHPRNQYVIEVFETKKQENILEQRVFPEVVSTLKFFKDRGVRCFICSSTASETILEYARRHRLEDWLDGCLGYRPGFGKDRQLESIVQDYHLRPEEVVLVGDSLRDHDFVKDKGIGFIGIHRMFDPQEFRQRGLVSASDLAAFTSLCGEAERLNRFLG